MYDHDISYNAQFAFKFRDKSASVLINIAHLFALFMFNYVEVYVELVFSFLKFYLLTNCLSKFVDMDKALTLVCYLSDMLSNKICFSQNIYLYFILKQILMFFHRLGDVYTDAILNSTWTKQLVLLVRLKLTWCLLNSIRYNEIVARWLKAHFVSIYFTNGFSYKRIRKGNMLRSFNENENDH